MLTRALGFGRGFFVVEVAWLSSPSVVDEEAVDLRFFDPPAVPRALMSTEAAASTPLWDCCLVRSI